MSLPEPNTQEGIEYWNKQPASYNGVLGGFGNGSLPRIDALGSRQFLLYLKPELSTVPSAIKPLAPSPKPPGYRVRALDVGAGVGRVTSDVLLHLVDDVVLLEPVEIFIQEAIRRGKEQVSEGRGKVVPWKGIRDKTKSVTFIQGTLQDFDPSRPLGTPQNKFLGRVGFIPKDDSLTVTSSNDPLVDIDSKFDVLWCQWCLGHLSDSDLIAFLQRCKAAMRNPDEGFIVVKENLGSEEEGVPRTTFDESDSSLTRSDSAWKSIFKQAGLTLLHEQIQKGFPAGLYEVRMYALR